MKVTWLTQGGLLFKNGDATVLVDPYLSDAVSLKTPEMVRRIPIAEEYLNISVDVILITHNHIDHLDPETLGHYFASADGPITVLAPSGSYEKLREFGGVHNYVLLDAHSVYSACGITFYAVRAAHSDRGAVGFILDDGEHTYYISGDTLYNFDVIDDVLDLAPDGVDFAFLPINGRGNNMHARDAADFAYEIGAASAIPVHYGLYDDVDPAEFDFEGARILKPYVEEEL